VLLDVVVNTVRRAASAPVRTDPPQLAKSDPVITA
jgi:hypothetical protein